MSDQLQQQSDSEKCCIHTNFNCQMSEESREDVEGETGLDESVSGDTDGGTLFQYVPYSKYKQTLLSHLLEHRGGGHGGRPRRRGRYCNRGLS